MRSPRRWYQSQRLAEWPGSAEGRKARKASLTIIVESRRAFPHCSWQLASAAKHSPRVLRSKSNNERSKHTKSGSRSPFKAIIFQHGDTNCIWQRPRCLIDARSISREGGPFGRREQFYEGDGRAPVVGKCQRDDWQGVVDESLRSSVGINRTQRLGLRSRLETAPDCFSRSR